MVASPAGNPYWIVRVTNVSHAYERLLIISLTDWLLLAPFGLEVLAIEEEVHKVFFEPLHIFPTVWEN